MTAVGDKMRTGARHAEQRIEEATRAANERMTRASQIIRRQTTSMMDQAKVGFEEAKQEAWVEAQNVKQQLAHGVDVAGEKLGSAKLTVEEKSAMLLEATKAELLLI